MSISLEMFPSQESYDVFVFIYHFYVCVDKAAVLDAHV